MSFAPDHPQQASHDASASSRDSSSKACFPLIDSHCHLSHPYHSGVSPAQLIQEGLEAGVQYFLNVGTQLSDLKPLAQLSETHPEVFHSVGIHPQDAAEIHQPDALAQLQSAAQHPRCLAIGEIGLDAAYPQPPLALQLEALNRQLELAVELELPVIIHSRQAEEPLLAALTQAASMAASRHRRLRGVIHCFSGTLEFGQACIDLGFYLSFSGILTFKKAEEVRTAAKVLPLARLLLETDSPFLAPLPHRGKPCRPAMIVQTAKVLAEVKQLPLEEVARRTTQNSCELFGLPAAAFTFSPALSPPPLSIP